MMHLEEEDIHILKEFKLSTLFFVILVSFFITLSLSGKVYCDNWVYVESNDHNISIHYNSSSVKIDKANQIIKVLLKIVYTPKGRESIISFFGSKPDLCKYIGKMNYVDYNISLLNIDYNEMISKIVRVSYYSRFGLICSREIIEDYHDINRGGWFEDMVNKILNDNKIRR